jgi:pimeloyl-ACP methyl ester carboxylesterase
MANDIATYLKYANLQMAAEALFGKQLSDPGATFSGEIEPSVLTFGNTRASKFTATQATEFASLWEVVEHISNTPTGFSGTLFKAKSGSDAALREKYGITAGELSLSFRSTEFADDAARDNQATNTMEIKEFGWAFGQIADMKKWVDGLNIPATQPLSVTGYSLGGHLAAAFNLLYPAAAAATYTFNGAGIGKIRPGASLDAILTKFGQRRSLGANMDLFTTSVARDLYADLSDVFRANLPNFAVAIKLRRDDLFATLTATPVSERTKFLELSLLFNALDRMYEVAYEAERVVGLTSGLATSAAPTGVSTAAIEAASLDYQLAVLQAGQSTDSFGSIDAVQKAYKIISRTTDARSNVFDIFGDTNPSMVSNSQRHLGQTTPIWIEDQPEQRGSVKAEAIKATFASGGAKLLVPSFGLNDFGDTHSLVLIIDSLSVQNALAQLDPKLSAATFKTIATAGSNTKVETGFAAAVGPDNQGKADGDTLEAMVNALGTYLGIHGEDVTGSSGRGNSAKGRRITTVGCAANGNRYYQTRSCSRNILEGYNPKRYVKTAQAAVGARHA